jgi:serine/threonine protein phosphatase PrpC
MGYELPENIITDLRRHEGLINDLKKLDYIDLQQLLMEKPGESEPYFIRQLWLALLHIAAWAHANGKVIGDLKPSSLWFRKDPEIKFYYFDTDKDLFESGPVSQTNISMWSAPEVSMKEGQLSPASDIFHLAAVILSLFVGVDAFANDTGLFFVLDRIRNLCPNLPEDLTFFLFRHLQRDPERRPRDAEAEIELFKGITEQIALPPNLLMQGLVWARTDAGAAKRRQAAKDYTYSNDAVLNQDSYVLRKLYNNVHLLGVFDGVSTCTLGSGGQAASIAQGVFEEQLFDAAEFEKAKTSDDKFQFLRKWLNETLKEANRNIATQTQELFLQAKEQKKSADSTHTMTTTATVAIVMGNRFVLGWAGDSPALHLNRRFGAIPLTYAHDATYSFLKAGNLISSAFHLSRESGVTKFLGGVNLPEGDEKLIDAVEVITIESDFVEGLLFEDSVLMIASDGIMDQRSEPFLSLLSNITTSIDSSDNAGGESWPEMLFEKIWVGANHVNQQDNITLLIHFPYTRTSGSED